MQALIVQNNKCERKREYDSIVDNVKFVHFVT